MAADYDNVVAGMSAQPAAGKWDKAVQQFGSQQDDAGSRAALAVSLSADQNPDQAALHKALATRYNTTPEVVAAYPEEFKQRMSLELARSNMQAAPKLQQTLANQPQTAALIHDDIPNAAGLEQALTLGDASYYGRAGRARVRRRNVARVREGLSGRGRAAGRCRRGGRHAYGGCAVLCGAVVRRVR
jgi:hypothetical protein